MDKMKALAELEHPYANYTMAKEVFNNLNHGNFNYLSKSVRREFLDMCLD